MKATARGDPRTRPATVGAAIRPRRVFWPVAVAALAILTGCAQQLRLEQQQPRSCSDSTLSVAAAFHEKAKDFLARHFIERDPASLQYAYYAARDTEELTRSIRFCDDFDREYRRRGSDLIRSARILRRVVVGNMRDNDPLVLVQLLGPAYDEVFRSDIR